MNATQNPTDQPVRRMADLKRINKEQGHHFFSKGAMRAFNSTILPTLYRVDDYAGVFITTEFIDYSDGTTGPVQYNVRTYGYKTLPAGDRILSIDTVSTHHTMTEALAAVDAAKATLTN